MWQFGLAVGQGVGVLADLHPAAATLPFDVVTTPPCWGNGRRVAASFIEGKPSVAEGVRPTVGP